MKKLLLLAIPAIILAFALSLKAAIGPYWLGANSDPSYLYLLNSLYLVDGITPIFTDHPGITLQMIGAAVIRLLAWGTPHREIAVRVLKDPEFYLNGTYRVLLFLQIISLAGAGYYAWRKSGSVIAGMLVQIPAFLYLTIKSYDAPHYVLPVVANINGETLLITIGNLYAMTLIKIYYDRRPRDSVVSAVMAGVVCALGLATKIPSLPFCMGPLIVLPGRRNKVFFMMTLVAAWFLATSPLIPHYANMFAWVEGLIVKKGFHGSGGAGFLDVPQALAGLWKMVRRFWFLFFMAGAGLLTAGYFRFSNVTGLDLPEGKKRNIKFLAVTAVMIFAHFLLLMKQTSPHYMTSGVGLSGLVCFFLYQSLSGKDSLKGVGAVFFLAAFVAANAVAAYSYQQNLARTNGKTLDFYARIHQKYDGCIIAGFYRSSGLTTAIDFAEGLESYRKYRFVLAKLYPDAVFYNRWHQQFAGFLRPYHIKELLAKNSCILLQGPDREAIPKYVQVEQVESSPLENLFRVTKVTIDEAVAYYTLARRMEAQGRYREALVFASRAQVLGYPKILPYLEELKQKAGLAR